MVCLATRSRLPRLARRYDREAHAPLIGVGVQRLLLAPLLFAGHHQRSAARRDRTRRNDRPWPIRLTDTVTERSTDMQDLTLVIGATGKTGRRVAERLRARGRPSGWARAPASRRLGWED